MNRYKINFALHGRYMFERSNEVGELIERTPWFDNIITNVGKDQFLTLTAGATFAPVVGTGSTAPAATDTTLATFLAGVSTGTGAQTYLQEINFSSAPYYVRLTFKTRFGLGVAAGNVSEVGMHASNSTGTTPNAASQLFSRALVKDALGTPVVVTVLPTEYLDVTWELTIYITTSTSGTVPQNIKGVNTTPAYVMTPAATAISPVGAFSGGWGLLSSTSGTGAVFAQFPIPFTSTNASSERTRLYPNTTAQPAISATSSNGTNASTNNASSVSSAAYTPGTFYRDFTYSWGLNYGNGNTIRCFKLDIAMGAFWIYYTDSSSFNKANTDVLDVTIRLTVS